MICYHFLQEPKIVDIVMTFKLNDCRNTTPSPPSTPPNSVAGDDEGFLEGRSVCLLKGKEELFVGSLGNYFRKSPITVLDSSTDTEDEASYRYRG